jgi:hypothetical protein
MRWCFSLALLALCLVPAAASPAVAAIPSSAKTPDLDLSFASGDLAVAAMLPEGATLRLRGVPLGPDRDLELRRIQVFAPDARLVVRSAGSERRLPVPAHAYFSGGVSGEPGSRVALSVLTSGEVRGVVAAGGRWWTLGKLPSEALTRVVEADAAALAERTGGFECEADGLRGTELLEEAAGSAAAGPEAATAGLTSVPAPGVLPGHTARIAFETDQEYLALFGGNAAAAIDYIGDLVAFGSTIYAAEIDTNLVVSSVNLWQTTDPWTENSTRCRFLQFGRHWNDNNGAVDRTIAHFLSGRSSGSGIAWVGVLCRGGFNSDISGSGCSGLMPSVDNYGGGYGYSSGLDANFNPNNPQVIWDFMVVVHEIGHNFNSPHSHCYAGLGGNANPVDQCYGGECGLSGCYCGATSLPCATPGAGCGTIMSYCHLLSGGLGNTSPTFGLGHPFGTAPGRIPARMSAHVLSTAAQNPSCLAPTLPGTLFDDGFESGNTSAWSGAVGG